jgi:hypothetical protein
MWLYLVLSLLDYLCTVLLCHLTAHNIEGNPLASYFAQNYGAVGLGIYKLVCTTVFLYTLKIINMYKRRYTKPLLYFGCCVLLVTVGYSGYLMLTEL